MLVSVVEPVCGRGPITDAIAVWTDSGSALLGGFALALIKGFTNSEPKCFRKLSLVSAELRYFFR